MINVVKHTTTVAPTYLNNNKFATNLYNSTEERDECTFCMFSQS